MLQPFAEGGVTSCVCGQDGSLYTSTDAGTVAHILAPFGAAALAAPRAWAAHARAVTRLSLGGAVLASASRDGTVALWRAGGAVGAPGASSSSLPPTPLATLAGHELTVSAVSVTGDGARVASGSRDCSVRLWDASSGGELCSPAHVPQNVVTCLQWAPGQPQQVLLQGGEDLRVRLWDARAGLLRAVGALQGFTYFPLALDAASDGCHVATSSKGFNGVGCEVRLWDVRRLGQGSSQAPLLRTFAGHSQDATAVLFVSQGRLASGSKDGTVRLWAWQEEGGQGSLGREAVLPLPGASVTSLAACAQGLIVGCAEDRGLALVEGVQACKESGGENTVISS